MSGKVRVLVVDDSSFMRSILSRMIEKDARLEVVGKATNGEEGVRMTQELKPDVVTMDIEMPIMNGIAALSKIMETVPTPVVMVSTLTEEGASATLESLEKGAVDFIPKALKDKDKNIFSSGDKLSDKLVAASKAHVQLLKKPVVPVSSVAPISPVSAPAAPVVIPVGVELKPRKDKMASAKILVIGSSTGGPRSLQDVIPVLPATLRVPVVVAQHMPPHFTKAMAERLDAVSALTVEEAENGGVLRVGHVYIAPGGMNTRVVMRGSELTFDIRPDDKNESLYHPSVDILTDSVSAAVGGANVLAAMLTGMGADGAAAFARVGEQGGYIVAQDEATSIVYGMPKAVAEKGCVSEILPLGQIASSVTRLLS